MVNRKNIFSILLVIVCFVGCATQEKNSWKEYEDKNPHLYEKNYKGNEDLPLEKRGILFSKELEKNLQDTFKEYQINIVANSIEINDRRYKLLADKIKKMPKPLKELIEKRVLAWTIVKGLDMSGTVIVLRSLPNNYYGKSIVIVDEKIFDKPINYLFKLKENSFYKNGDYVISGRANKEVSSELYIFLHEAAHALAINNSLVYIQEETDYLKYYLSLAPFSKISWKVNEKNNDLISIDKDIELWPLIRKYYTKKDDEKLENGLAHVHFKEYMKSDFSTLYGTNNTGEDWAESFTLKAFEKYYGINFEYFLESNGEEILKHRPCQNNKTCEFKNKIIDMFLEKPDLYLESW